MKKRPVLRIVALIVLLLLSFVTYYMWLGARIVTAYSAKIACTNIFATNRTKEAVLAWDLSAFPMIDLEVNESIKSVTASIGPVSNEAVYRGLIGSTLIKGKTRKELVEQAKNLPSNNTSEFPSKYNNLFLFEDIEGWNRNKLDAAIDNAFKESDSENPKWTRAVVVAYKQMLVAERYGEGFDKDTPLIGWSMTKSVMNALVGRLIMLERCKLNDPINAPEWKDEKDPRRALTVDHLLRMSSGLVFRERYSDPWADVLPMLFDVNSAASYAADKALAYDIDSHWSYSSGTSNILARFIQQRAASNLADSWKFPHTELFSMIGMDSAVLETDAAGHFIGSSFMYATAQDWTRFGLLYLNDGKSAGKRLLPKGWVEYTTTPTPKAPNGRYGAHFWLNAGDDASGKNRPLPNVPKDAFMCRGYQGQSVTIIPSRKAVIVRMGLTKKRSSFNLDQFLSEILEGLPQ